MGTDPPVRTTVVLVGTGTFLPETRSKKSPVSITLSNCGPGHTMAVGALVVVVSGCSRPCAACFAAVTGGIVTFASVGSGCFVRGIGSVGNIGEVNIRHAVNMPLNAGVALQGRSIGRCLGMTDLAIDVGIRIFEMLRVGG